jgi:signal transduction histidine kinase
LTVTGDGGLLPAMLDNLSRNAIRHSPMEETVEIEVAVGPQEASITVRDRGPGPRARILS